MRAVGLDVCRPADHITQFVDVMDVAQRHGLREQIADGGALDGAGHDGAVDGVGCKLVEKLVLAATADDVQRIDALALDLLETLERPAVFERERFIDAPRDLPDSFRNRLVRFTAERLNLLDHPTAREELAVVGIDDRTEGLCLLRILDNIVPAEAHSCRNTTIKHF